MTGVSLPEGWWGFVIALGGIVFPFAVAWRRGKVDESAAILGRWKEMVDQHAEDIKALRDELRIERNDNAILREELSEARRKIVELEDQVTGLRRQLAMYIGPEGYLVDLVEKVGRQDKDKPA